jgi:hypothetical protein
MNDILYFVCVCVISHYSKSASTHQLPHSITVKTLVSHQMDKS